MSAVLTTAAVAAMAAIAAATLTLTGCNNKSEDRTVGQQVDRAIAKVENAGEQAKQSSGDTARGVGAGAKDVAITAKIKGALAADGKLSAIRIDVDTQAGKVTLNGKAPDATSRDRATTLAQGVDGVVSVDNKLSVN